MKGLIIVSVLITVSSAALLLDPKTHIGLQNLCGDLANHPVLDEFTGDRKVEVATSLAKVCDIYNKKFFNPTEKRGILDGLSGLVGENSKLNTILKAASALNKAKDVFDEIKKVAPTVHDHVQGGIKDVHDTLQELIDSITGEFMDKTDTTTAIPMEKRGILDGLSGLLGENSKLNTILKAASALNKAKDVFDEIKKVAPTVHDHVQGGIKDVHDTLQDLIDSITGEYMDKTTMKPGEDN